MGIGGDHSITLAELRALAAVHGPLALIHFDAHCDLWDSYFGHKYTHGTPFRRAVEEGLLLPERSIQLGMRGPVYDEEDVQLSAQLGFLALSTTELLAYTPAEIGAIVRERVGDTKAFLSFDVDFFDPAFAPGTGTPEVGGPTSFQGLAYLRSCVGLNWVGADVVEVERLEHVHHEVRAAALVVAEHLDIAGQRGLRGLGHHRRRPAGLRRGGRRSGWWSTLSLGRAGQRHHRRRAQSALLEESATLDSRLACRSLLAGRPLRVP